MGTEAERTQIAIVLLVWASGIVSSFLDNIPYTATMVPVIRQLAAAQPDGAGLDLQTLAWSLCIGACLGGNGTQIGASANIVVASIAHRRGYTISFLQFFKVAFPITLFTLAIGMTYAMLRYGLPPPPV